MDRVSPHESVREFSEVILNPAKSSLVLLLGALLCLAACAGKQEPREWLHNLSEDEALELLGAIGAEIEQGRFEPSLGSLRKYEIPEWHQDAKFGLWVCCCTAIGAAGKPHR